MKSWGCVRSGMSRSDGIEFYPFPPDIDPGMVERIRRGQLPSAIVHSRSTGTTFRVTHAPDGVVDRDDGQQHGYSVQALRGARSRPASPRSVEPRRHGRSSKHWTGWRAKGRQAAAKLRSYVTPALIFGGAAVLACITTRGEPIVRAVLSKVAAFAGGG